MDHKKEDALSLHNAFKRFGLVEVQLRTFLYLTLERCQLSDSYPGCFAPRGKSPIAVRWEAEGDPVPVERGKLIASNRIRIPNSRLCSHHTD